MTSGVRFGGLSLAIQTSRIPRGAPDYDVANDKASAINDQRGGEYIGCFAKAVMQARLPPHPEYTCLALCQAGGWRFSGYSGNECYCDNSLRGAAPVAATSCNTLDKAGYMRGGSSHVAVYAPHLMDRLTEPLQYMGCWRDVAETPDLEKQVRSESTRHIHRVTDCINRCRLDDLWHYAAVQNGTTCYCGNAYGSHGALSEDACAAHKDLDDGATPMGGEHANAVFLITARHFGCFRDHGADLRDLPRDVSETGDASLTIRKCLDYCKRRSYSFAGLQAGTRCFCGHDAPRTEIASADCTTACSGNPNEICGGTNANSVYIIGSQRTKERRIGCYPDDDYHQVQVQHLFSPRPSTCATQCQAYGYAFAGLRDGGECFCGDSYFTKEHRLLDDSQCADTPCRDTNGQQNGNCGGAQKLYIYAVEDTVHVGEYAHTAAAKALDTLVGPMSVERCTEHCAFAGHAYAGNQKGTCWCGNHINGEPRPAAYSTNQPDGRPNNGDSSITAGSTTTLPIYLAKDVEYMGCFTAEASKLHHVGTAASDSEVRDCSMKCVRQGYKFAAIKRETECHCGDLMEGLNAANDTSCPHQCHAGGAAAACGGDSAYSVYASHRGLVYVGCYKKQGDLTSSPTYKHTPTTCTRICGAQGFVFAAITAGDQCQCGNNYDASELGLCDLPCSRDLNRNCAIAGEYSVYQALQFPMVGCFEGLGHNPEKVDIDAVDVGQCQMMCRRLGHLYAAMSNGRECLCGGGGFDPSNGRKDASECNSKCLHDESLTCGGSGTFQAYDIGVRHQGCFEVDSRFNQKMDKMNVTNFGGNYLGCAQRCRHSGYLYMAVSKDDCFCGDEFASHAYAAGNCAFCGDSNLFCGSETTASVYFFTKGHHSKGQGLYGVLPKEPKPQLPSAPEETTTTTTTTTSTTTTTTTTTEYEEPEGGGPASNIPAHEVPLCSF
eukprot:GHVU01007488.1.p1 GENE.GHVU01007488.1~~GHVU01007488.1.p1  ORF type:complete len:991 (-),score=207.87 GHVU01007488.1:110-2944(-)